MARITVEDCLQNVDNLFQLVLLADRLDIGAALAGKRRWRLPVPARQAEPVQLLAPLGVGPPV